MLVLGLGLGMVMQVLVLAVQNAVPYDMLGVATSGSTLFRSIGGSLGTAVLGAIFSARLAAELAGDAAAPRTSAGSTRRRSAGCRSRCTTPTSRPSPTRCIVVFLVATVVVALAFVLSWFIEERPLRKTVETNVGESLGAPVDTDSMSQLTRALSRLVGRERTLVFMAETVARAGVDLSPSASWALLRLGAPDPITVAEAAALPHVDAGRLAKAVDELCAAGLHDGERPTEAGHAMRVRLVAARTDGLRILVADWEPDENPELDPLLRRLADELAAPA